MGTRSVLSLCNEAAQDLNIIMAGSTLNAMDGATVLRKLNLVLDDWNASREAVYAVRIDTFTTVPSLSPHTLGPTGATWTLAQRPVAIEACALVESGDPTPIDVQTDPTWWATRVNQTRTSRPTSVFYNPAWPNGELYFWPVPSSAFSMRLVMRAILPSVLMTDSLALPQGYESALMGTLIEAIAGPFERTVTPAQTRLASRARARVFANATPIPRHVSDVTGLGMGR